MRSLSILAAATALAATALAGGTPPHSQVSAVAVNPNDADEIWVCNRDNNSVSVIDVSVDPPSVVEIEVGIKPRSLAFNADGSRVLVANQRGNIPLDANFVTGFPATQERGSVSVVDVATHTVQLTMTNTGVEPYGVALSPNEKWFAVSGFRSGTIKFYDATTLTEILVHQYARNLNFLPANTTIADADSNRDGIADTGDPRGFVIRGDSERMFVTHNKSSYVSVLDITLDVNGLPTAVVEAAKVETNEYQHDTFFNPNLVQTVESQGVPRFLEDIALSPDGSRLLVPHLLHNLNHDVNHDFGGAIEGDFANRVYPALTMIDAANLSYAQAGDNSTRLHHEIADDPTPAEFISYGDIGTTSAGDNLVLGGLGSPLIGTGVEFVVSGWQPGDVATLLYGNNDANLPFGTGTLLVAPRFLVPMPGGQATINIPNFAGYVDFTAHAQALVLVNGGPELVLSNGIRFNLEFDGLDVNEMGHRAGHPSRVAYNEAGDHAILLNRGSEDVFLYSVNGSDMRLRSVFPPRHGHEERAPLDDTTPLGDIPMGMVLVDDPSTVNDDALLYVINEGNRTLSTLRVDYTAGTIHQERDQIATVLSADEFTLSERIGQELFEDSSRAQTAGNFNNSCASCHFEGGEDGNIWQRGAGPRSTMPVYGGTLGTGMILWKGVRLNMGETGPMFGGENGGTGVLTDAEQQGLIDYHEVIAFPLNPNLDPVTGDYTVGAEFGKDLYFGTNDTGLNPNGRHAGCAECHPDEETNAQSFPGPRFYTADFVHPMLSSADNLETFDPDCFSLRENIVALNIRNVNSGVNVDQDNDGFPDLDRNNDGFVDLETYPVMNIDKNDDFTRDDQNGYLCPCDPNTEPNCDANLMIRIFTRDDTVFSIPSKLGVFSSAPYFHDHAPYSLRTLINPKAQALDAVYGDPAWGMGPQYPGLNKIFNEEHDIFGDESMGGISDVQLNLQSGSAAQKEIDFLAILEYIQSL